MTRKPHEVGIVKTNTIKIYEWLKDISTAMGWEEEERNSLASLAILKTVLHELRDNLLLESSAHLSAQLPTFVRGLYFEGWQPARIPLRERKQDEFLSSIKTHLKEGSHPDIDAEQAAKAVFRTLASKISEGEAHKIKQSLPKHIKELWG